jgi:hypothetical protein
VNRWKTAAAAGLLGILVAVGALLGAQHEWPFSKSSTRSTRAGANSEGWFGPKREQIRPVSEIWSGEVSLALNQHYALNEKSVKSLEPCGGCLTLESHPGGALMFHAENGILVWPKQGRPSYLDCVRLRESGTLDAVPLKTSPHDGGLPIHRWLCATSGTDDDILRLQYQGPGQGRKDYRFVVTAWPRPLAN